MSETWKKYPEEAQERLNKLLAETKETREILDNVDKDLFSTPNPSADYVRNLARQATGGGNYLRKKLGVLTAAVKNERSNRYMEIKIEASSSGSKFTDGAAKEEAEGYVGPLRTARDVLEAYVISADNIVSFARMHLSNKDLPEQSQSQVDI